MSGHAAAKRVRAGGWLALQNLHFSCQGLTGFSEKTVPAFQFGRSKLPSDSVFCMRLNFICMTLLGRCFLMVSV